MDELLFLPLGGAGEIGMNLYLYGYGPSGKERWLMVDLGITFGDDTLPGVDIMMPDPTFIEERIDQLEALVLTHAHEDHIGAVGYLWPKLRCPIFATSFTANILEYKLVEAGINDQVDLKVVPLGGVFDVGPFRLEFITLTHSIPEPNAIAIKTPLGTVLHTGDWKFDPNPVIGNSFDRDSLIKLGENGTLAIICDSTNNFTPGTSGSEGDLLKSFTELISSLSGRVVVTCFASNVARLETIALAALANDRSVVLAGRALWKFYKVGRKHDCFSEIPAFLEADQVGHLPNDNTLIICTGSQGEPRAALSRIADGSHPSISLDKGDTVIFSSKVIPGNENAIGRLQNQLIRSGVQILTELDSFVHVSGHPGRQEMVQMYQYVRPNISIPVHGELRHMREHANLAVDCQVPHTIVGENGSVIRIAPGEPEILDHVHSGRLSLEGKRLVPIEGELVVSRKRALWNGSVVVTVVINQEGKLASDPLLTTTGILDDDDYKFRVEIIDLIKNIAENGINNNKEETLRLAVRKLFRDKFGKKPVTHVHLIEM